MGRRLVPPQSTLSPHLHAPQIDPTKKGQVIGPGGRIINLIRETSKVGEKEGEGEVERLRGVGPFPSKPVSWAVGLFDIIV